MSASAESPPRALTSPRATGGYLLFAVVVGGLNWVSTAGALHVRLDVGAGVRRLCDRRRCHVHARSIRRVGGEDKPDMPLLAQPGQFR